MDCSTGLSLSLQEHISQSVADVICTPLGSRVMRRDYGSLIPELIDQPHNGDTAIRVYAAAASALKRWEPRVTVTSIALLRGETPGMATLQLDARISSTLQNVKLQIPLTGY